jgi:phosphatidylglycerol:prolipoprotein diacylglycerol transferase
MPPRLHYSLFMLLALGTFLLTRQLVPKPAALATLPRRQRWLLVAAAFVGGALCAKVPFVLGAGGGVFSELAWFRDGKTITTGLVGAYLAVELAKLLLGLDVKTGDTFALPLALALAVGRWGCFFNGCCYGVETSLPWGIDFGDGVRRHPTQIYESLYHLGMAGVLIVLLRQGWLRYQHLKFYLIAYGAYRFATEFIRPEPAEWLRLTFYQWVSVALIFGLSVQWAFDRQRQLREAAQTRETALQKACPR